MKVRRLSFIRPVVVVELCQSISRCSHVDTRRTPCIDIRVEGFVDSGRKLHFPDDKPFCHLPKRAVTNFLLIPIGDAFSIFQIPALTCVAKNVVQCQERFGNHVKPLHPADQCKGAIELHAKLSQLPSALMLVVRLRRYGCDV